MSRRTISITVNAEAHQGEVPARRLLADLPRPTEAQVREGINGKLCRCTGYGGVVEAILAAARQMDGN